MSRFKKKTPIKLRDVAIEAEVSMTTASLALRHHPSVTDETRRRVLEAQKRLGYLPIRKRKTAAVPPVAKPEALKFLYCVVDFPLGKFELVEFLNGVTDACQKRGIRLDLRTVSSGAFFSGDWIPGDIDGVIITGAVNQKQIDFLKERGLRVMVLGNYDVSDVHAVEIDTFRAGRTIAQRIVEDGHQSVACVLRDATNFNERQFLMGLHDGLHQAGIRLSEERVFCVKNLRESVVQAIRGIIALEPAATAAVTHAANTAEACLSEIRCHRSADRRPDPEFYSVAILPDEPAPKGLHLLQSDGARCGRLAVDRLRQIVNQAPEFPSTTMLRMSGWI